MRAGLRIVVVGSDGRRDRGSARGAVWFPRRVGRGRVARGTDDPFGSGPVALPRLPDGRGHERHSGSVQGDPTSARLGGSFAASRAHLGGGKPGGCVAETPDRPRRRGRRGGRAPDLTDGTAGRGPSCSVADARTGVLPGRAWQRYLRSKVVRFASFCNSRRLSHFAAFVFDGGPEVSIVVGRVV